MGVPLSAFGEGHRRSVLQRISTASWGPSFRRGPPKLPSDSRFNLPSFSGEPSLPLDLSPAESGLGLSLPTPV